jgi:hypothetical protein
MGTLTYNQYIREMGVLYHYVDQVVKAAETEDVDNGIITTYKDVAKPNPVQFLSPFFFEWANKLTTI